MLDHFRRGTIWTAAGALLACLLCSSPASAQFPGGGPPRGGFPGGPGGGMGRPDDALINAPIEALASGLKLTPGQKTQITQIQDRVHKGFADLMMPKGGGPPDFGAMQANFGKVRKMDEDGTAQIKALLTPAQKQALPGTLKDIQTLQGAGIPPALLGTLKLTADQKQKLAAISANGQKEMGAKMQQAQQSGNFGAIRQVLIDNRKQTHDKALAVLTGAQKSQVEQYIKAHPQRGFGGGFGPPGGFRPPPGGFGGPPPGR